MKEWEILDAGEEYSKGYENPKKEKQEELSEALRLQDNKQEMREIFSFFLVLSATKQTEIQKRLDSEGCYSSEEIRNGNELTR